MKFVLDSLVPHLEKNLSAMQEIPVWFLGQEESTGEGIDHLLQYSWTSLVAQLVKNPPFCEQNLPTNNNKNPEEYLKMVWI